MTYISSPNSSHLDWLVHAATKLERVASSLASARTQLHTKNRSFDINAIPEVYVWRTRGDGKVRKEHAANHGKVFTRDNPPPTGHPGQDWGCRCEAEAFVNGQTEYASHTLISNISNQPQWELEDFAKHFFFGGGRSVSLSECGRLADVITFYENILDGGKNSLERISNQIAQEARNQPKGSFRYYFRRSYDEFSSYHRVFGGGIVAGEFIGTSKLTQNMIEIEGIITYNFSDTFTDPANIRENYYGTSDLDNISDPVRIASDLFGTFYELYGSWSSRFTASVLQNPKNSKFR